MNKIRNWWNAQEPDEKFEIALTALLPISIVLLFIVKRILT